MCDDSAWFLQQLPVQLLQKEIWAVWIWAMWQSRQKWELKDSKTACTTLSWQKQFQLVKRFPRVLIWVPTWTVPFSLQSNWCCTLPEPVVHRNKVSSLVTTLLCPPPKTNKQTWVTGTPKDRRPRDFWLARGVQKVRCPGVVWFYFELTNRLLFSKGPNSSNKRPGSCFQLYFGPQRRCELQATAHLNWHFEVHSSHSVNVTRLFAIWISDLNLVPSSVWATRKNRSFSKKLWSTAVKEHSPFCFRCTRFWSFITTSSLWAPASRNRLAAAVRIRGAGSRVRVTKRAGNSIPTFARVKPTLRGQLMMPLALYIIASH